MRVSGGPTASRARRRSDSMLCIPLAVSSTLNSNSLPAPSMTLRPFRNKTLAKALRTAAVSQGDRVPGIVRPSPHPLTRSWCRRGPAVSGATRICLPAKALPANRCPQRRLGSPGRSYNPGSMPGTICTLMLKARGVFTPCSRAGWTRERPGVAQAQLAGQCHRGTCALSGPSRRGSAAGASWWRSDRSGDRLCR